SSCGQAAGLVGNLCHRRMSGHDHDADGHDHAHSELGKMDLRVRALESVLTQKGYIDPAALDVLIDEQGLFSWAEWAQALADLGRRPQLLHCSKISLALT